jgi:S1-C subfamily serine protease
VKKLLLFLLPLSLLLFSGCLPEKEKPAVVKEEVVVPVGEGDFNPIEIYKRNAPGVVTVTATSKRGSGQGSGFLISKKGEVVTNAHVIIGENSDKRTKGTRVYLELQNGLKLPARIIAVDPDSDLALLQSNIPGTVKPLRLSQRKKLLPGEPVAAIGSPFGESQSLSTGIISAINRSVRSLTDFSIDNAIQTDASINPGNSGGPLLDARGEVIGINQQIQTTSGGNDGVGYAVPTEALRYVLRAVRSGERIRYAYLGVASQNIWPALSRKLRIPKEGVLLARVEKGSPADLAGLRGGERRVVYQGTPVVVGGDVIVEIDGEKITSSSDISNFVSDKKPGDKVRVVYFSRGKERETEVLLRERP